MIFGYRSEDPQLAAMMNGGGFLSMVQVSVIVGISSAYAGIFEGTGLLLGIKRYVEAVSRRITPFGGILAVSVVTSMISFNQTLAIILTDQLTKDAEPDKEKRALALEDTVVLMAAWCLVHCRKRAHFHHRRTHGQSVSGILSDPCAIVEFCPGFDAKS